MILFMIKASFGPPNIYIYDFQIRSFRNKATNMFP